MRTVLSNEVPVFKLQSFSRLLVAAALSLSGLAAAQPVNDACAGAEVLTLTGTSPVVSSTATRIDLTAVALESPFACSTTSKNSVWYQFTALVNGIHRIETCGAVTNYDTVIQAYSGTSCGALTSLGTTGCNNAGTSCTGSASSLNLTLTAGTTYFVQVAAASAVTPTATMVTNLTVTPPRPPPANDACGSAEPIVPNGTANVVSSIALVSGAAAAAEAPFSCLVTPTNANSSVWYSITPTVTASYRIESCAGTAAGANISDTVLSLYTGTCGALTGGDCSDDFCAARSSITSFLTAGTTYYVQLAKFGPTAPALGTDALQLSVVQIVNGPTDVCSGSSPQLDLLQPVVVSTVAAPDGGYSIAQNNAQLDGGANFSGIGQTSTTAPGRDVAYQFRAATAGNYSFRIGTPSVSVDALIYLTDSCVPVTGANVSTYGPPQCIAAANRNTSLQEQISCVPLGANQTVFVWVDEVATSNAGSTLTLEATPCTAEVEPNGTPLTASPLSCVVTGSIGTTTDVDFFAVGAPPAGSRVFAMAEGGAANASDFDLRVTTDTTTLEYDDVNLVAPFGGTAPVIAGTVLNGLPAYLRVNYFSATAAEPYVLYSAVQSGAPTPEAEPNDSIATATPSTKNYFTGSITDGGTDVDFFSFSANAGDLIFAALDAVPDKTDAGPGTYNFVMSLVDSTNAIVLTVDDTSNTTTFTPTGGSLTASTPTFPAEGLVFRARSTGNYGIRVGKTSGTNPNPYVLSVSVGCSDTLPTLTTVSPTSGTPSGGQTITLTGTNFSSRSVVRFGTGIATIVSVTPTELIVTSPAGSSGDVAVSVTNGIGLSATLNPGYTYDDPPGLPPILTGISPIVGPVTGGTVVTLTGTVFRADAGVFFDVGGTVVGAASVTVNNATRITATTPPQLEGIASVQVVNYDALQSTLPNAFTFQGPPSVTGITPNTGLTTGGLTITLTGRNFRAGTTVRIGGNLATAVTPAADGLSLTAVTPSVTVNGPADVIVRTSDGQSTTVTAGFTYAYPAPTITSLSATSGFAVGGQALTITGTNFLASPTVTFGGAAATNVVRTSATQITLTTPPGTPGLVDVVVTNSDTQSVTRTGAFTYVAAPVLSSITPVHGPVQGGTRVTLTGTDFTRGAVVLLGGVPAFAVDVVNSTTITAVTNAGAPGLVDVRVVNADTQASTLTGAFTYDPAPTLESATPISGSTAGGTAVTLTGTGFLTGATVFFGSDAATTVTLVSSTELTATTPAHAVGVVSITVRNLDNQSALLPRAYRFVAPPSVASLSPDTGDVAGGTVVHITGAGFNAGTTVSFGGTAATQVALNSSTEIDAVTPAHMPGVVDVVVSAAGASATLTGAFTYTRGAPTLTAVAPASGPTAGGTLLTLTGTGFAPGATISVGGSAATDVVIVSNVLARAVAPAHAAGAVDVVLTNDDAQLATLMNGFTYVAPLSNETGTVTDGGSGSLGSDATGGGGAGGGGGSTGAVSCGCSGFDGSMFSMAGFGLMLVLSRRRRRS